MNLCGLRAGVLCLGLSVAAALALGSAPEAVDRKKPAASPQEELWRAPRPHPVPTPEPAALAQARQRGVAFLVTHQNRNGSWGGPELRGGVEIYAPVPAAFQAFQGGVTALAVSALLETGGDDPQVRQAIARGQDWLLTHLPRLRRASPDVLYNVWGHIYAIQAAVRSWRTSKTPQQRQRWEEFLREQIALLQRYESVDHGWGYYDFRVGSQRPATDSMPFVTAAALVALYEAQQIGVRIPAELVRHAMASIQRQRNPDFSYLYGEYLKYMPRHPINRPGGSLGRSQVCNLALRLWGDPQITDAVLQAWLDRLFARNGWLDLGRTKPIPHESFFAVAGYFFYFGHYYAAGCIEQLPAARRPFYQDQLATVLLRRQGKDGAWWDFPLYNYHHTYGTAFALMALERCRHAPGPVAPPRK